jgi:hypothetical protein
MIIEDNNKQSNEQISNIDTLDTNNQIEFAEYFEPNYKSEVAKNLRQQNLRESDYTPWERYNELKTGPVPEPQFLFDKILQVSKFNNKLAATLSLLYLTGSRVQEITKYKYEGKYEATKDDKELWKPPIRCKDIWLETDEDEITWIVIKTRVEKRREKKDHFKFAYIYYNPENYLWPLIKIVEEYLDTNFTNVHPDTWLWDFSTDYLRQSINKYLNLVPHILRVYRAKHLVRYDHFDVTALQLFFGWATADLAAQYAASDVQDMKRRILGRI